MGRCATIAYVIAETILDNICDPYAGLLYKILTHQIGNYKGKPTSASAQGPWGSLVSFQLWELVTPVQIWADPLLLLVDANQYINKLPRPRFRTPIHAASEILCKSLLIPIRMDMATTVERQTFMCETA